ncbi:thylakoid lumenal 15.0 kDa protein 2, chloroplastic [Coffea arabica]|uniref:Thylakoid lumenal 15.0 kDa protein 2, chloroplastic n=1 Tax=Coffea arabica TaxID=13443 RepID=A0A6P6T1N3_COFAR|nr:thylakoid lumenal 15.0 kDa protein 2, chloroplastic [Coffea arabica]
MGFPLLYQHPPLSIATLMPASGPKFPVYPKYKASATQKEISILGQKSTQLLSSKWFADNLRSGPVNFFLSGSLALALSLAGVGIAEGKVGVNKPELLPKEFTPVIDVAGFLSDGQENRLAQEIAAIEKDTGFKLRVLAQNYPDTPGLAIKDFWKVDDRTIVFVADPTFGNILNFNVGASVDIDVPRSFWGRLAGKYGNMFYWKEKGEDASIEAAVVAIGNCLREPVGANNCSESRRSHGATKA